MSALTAPAPRLAAVGEWLKIWLLCIAAAILYGILHDQVTARLCLAYFTVGHAPVFPTQDPTLLGIGWGVIATWWVGASLGLPTVLAMRVGRRPVWGSAQLVRPLAALLASVGLAALLAGIAGYALAQAGLVHLPQVSLALLPPGAEAGFISAGWAHLTSYAGGMVGGAALWVWLWRHRSPAPAAPRRPRLRAVGLGVGLVLLAALWLGGLFVGYTVSQSTQDYYFPAGGR